MSASGSVSNSKTANNINNINPESETNDTQIGDQIGNTVYSQQFVLSTLIELTKELESCETSSDANDGQETVKLELCPELETQICFFWDMTADEQVTEFVVQIDCFLPLCAKLIAKSMKPRLVEIMLGVVCNLSVNIQNKSLIMDNVELRSNIMHLVYCRDAETLIQLYRMFQCVMERDCWMSDWNEIFKVNDGYAQTLDVLATTANEHVLHQVSSFLTNWFDLCEDSSQIAGALAETSLQSICAAIEQSIKHDLNDCLSHLLRLLHLWTTNQHTMLILAIAKPSQMECIMGCVCSILSVAYGTAHDKLVHKLAAELYCSVMPLWEAQIKACNVSDSAKRVQTMLEKCSDIDDALLKQVKHLNL